MLNEVEQHFDVRLTELQIGKPKIGIFVLGVLVSREDFDQDCLQVTS